jgi:16S rRNA (adenine1518-N6/adenine1519-N6)-dimethyltransferase
MTNHFSHKKSLGQNFLTSDYVPKKLCDAADLQVGETVLEIGPGTGMLTRELLARGAQVVAVEADPRAVAVLEEAFQAEIASTQLILHHHDARDLDLPALGLVDHHYKVVANIPYYLSGLLLRTLLESTRQPTTLIFLIQKELAERIARDPKESLLSLSVKAFGAPRYVETIKRGHFQPPPKVDSAILAVTNITRERFSTLTTKQFFTILHLGFGQKRKQLAHNLAGLIAADQIRQILNQLNQPPTARAEDLSIQDWLQFATHIAHTKENTQSMV